MITLSAILILWGIISIYRIHNITKKYKEPFNPYEGTIMDTLGFYVGISTMVLWIFVLCIIYLP
jgi:hypothetical protein